MSYPHLGPLLEILSTIAGEDRVDLDRLQHVTGLSHASLKRHMQAARDYGVVIEWEGGPQGRYVIRHWGPIDPTRLNDAQSHTARSR